MPDTAADRSALTLISETARQWNAALAEDLQREGASPEQYRVLERLDTRQGRAMNEISNETLVPPPTLTKIVDRLVDANLVHRRNDPLDRRRVLILLTPRGRALRQRLEDVVRAHHRRLDDRLGTDGVAQLAGLLNRLGADTD